jgi:hypothetical protein
MPPLFLSKSNLFAPQCSLPIVSCGIREKHLFAFGLLNLAGFEVGLTELWREVFLESLKDAPVPPIGGVVIDLVLVLLLYLKEDAIVDLLLQPSLNDLKEHLLGLRVVDLADQSIHLEPPLLSDESIFLLLPLWLDEHLQLELVVLLLNLLQLLLQLPPRPVSQVLNHPLAHLPHLFLLIALISPSVHREVLQWVRIESLQVSHPKSPLILN